MTVVMSRTEMQLARSVDSALAMLGATIDDVLDVMPTYGGEPYLVGSLAAGYGDRGSDIDVHVVTDDAIDQGPVLTFTRGGVCVDVRYVTRQRIDRIVSQRRARHSARPAGRADAWLVSRWLNSMCFNDMGPSLLDDAQAERGQALIVSSLVDDLVAMYAFTKLAESADVDRSWYLARRTGTIAWELAATLSGHNYLGSRWLPARSTDPRVALLARFASRVERSTDLAMVLESLAINPSEACHRVALEVNREAERWTVAGDQWLLVGGRRLIPRVDPAPATIEAALGADPGGVFHSVVNGALRWRVHATDIIPTLEVVW